MAKFGDNYRAGKGSTSCPLCLDGHSDSQQESFNCYAVTSQIRIDCEYQSLFKEAFQ